MSATSLPVPNGRVQIAYAPGIIILDVQSWLVGSDGNRRREHAHIPLRDPVVMRELRRQLTEALAVAARPAVVAA